MLRKVNFNSLHDDLRKIGVACIIGGITGLFLGPHSELLPLSLLAIIGLVLWYLGLSDGEINVRD